MIFLQLPKKALVLKATFFQNLGAHAAVESGDEVSLQVSANLRLGFKASRNFNRDRLDEFRSTRAIVQFSLYASKGPRPERLRDIDYALINGAILMICRWNPKRRYPSGSYLFLLALRLAAHEI